MYIQEIFLLKYKGGIMHKSAKSITFIKLSYWLGIGADAIWAIGLFLPDVYGFLLGNPVFSPGIELRLVMGIGGSLMLGWTILLLWAVRKPVERRGVLLITAIPVITGLFVIALIGFLGGNTANLWILIKTFLLFIMMITSYIVASKQKAS